MEDDSNVFGGKTVKARKPKFWEQKKKGVYEKVKGRIKQWKEDAPKRREAKIDRLKQEAQMEEQRARIRKARGHHRPARPMERTLTSGFGGGLYNDPYMQPPRTRTRRKKKYKQRTKRQSDSGYYSPFDSYF